MLLKETSQCARTGSDTDRETLRCLCVSSASHIACLQHCPLMLLSQFIVAEDGSCGLVYEHAPSEGPPIVALLDHIVEFT